MQPQQGEDSCLVQERHSTHPQPTTASGNTNIFVYILALDRVKHMVMEMVVEVITSESFSKLLLAHSMRRLVLGGASSPAARSLPPRNGNRF